MQSSIFNINTDAYSTCSDSWEKWDSINERRVTEITLHFFYQPRTLTLLLAGSVFMLYFAFTSDASVDRAMHQCMDRYFGSDVHLSFNWPPGVPH